MSKYTPEYYQQHKESIKKSTKKWRTKNIEKVRKYKRLYQKHRYDTDKKYRDVLKSQQALFYQRNSERIKARIKIWVSKNRDKVRTNAKAYYHRNAEARKKLMARIKESRRTIVGKARWKLSKAISQGIITRPSNCSKCLKNCKPHGHHTDYNKPIDVVWLCSLCHGKVHSKIRH